MVGGPFTTFTRANCNVPGKYGTPYTYWQHGSGLCVLEVWWPSQSYTNAPVALFVPGETYGHLEVYKNMHGMFSSYPKQLALAAAMSAAGWVVISVGYPGASLNSHTGNSSNSPTPGAFRISGSWGEIPPVAMWPEQPYYLARAIQHIKDNKDSDTPFGKRLLGVNNSINPNKIVLCGMKHGATIAMTTAMVPSQGYSYDSLLAHESQDMYFPRLSSRVAAVVATDPMIDFTQLVIATDYASPSPAPTFFQGDKWATFTRAEDMGPWSHVELIRKKVCPWWFLQEKYEENNNLGFYTEFSGTGYASALYDANLVASDWNPGVVGTVAGKLWIQPENGTFQGKPWNDALQALSGKITSSVTNYGSTLTSNGAYAGEVMDWLGGFGL